MLTVITGQKNEAKVFIQKLFETAQNKERAFVTITDSSFSDDWVRSYFGARDLFGKEYIIYLDRIFANSLARDFFWKELEGFIETSNQFILFEEKLSADDVKSIEKAGGKLVVSKKSGALKAKQDFNIFALADALGERDKKNLWVLYEKALRAGKTPEEIAGTLFWQLKTMLLVLKGGGDSLHPYVKGKTTRFVKKHSVSGLEKMSFTLIDEYHKSRLGGLSLAERLERFILSV